MTETADQTTSHTPTSFAAGAKIILDAVQTTFGMAVMVMLFFGLALVSLAFGFTYISSGLRAGLMWALILLMVGILSAVVSLRLWRPNALGAPPRRRQKT